MNTALRPALMLMVGVWGLLLVGRVATGWIGGPWGSVLAFGVATGLVWWAPGRPASVAPSGASRAALLLGAVAGYSSYPMVSAGTRSISGSPLMDAVPGELAVHLPSALPVWIAALALAPVFEEALYRERLFLPLRARFGALLAIVVSSVCFAVPHASAEAILPAFLAGLLLGFIRQVGRSLGLCIAFHAGLNLSAVLGGELPARAEFVAVALACLGAATLTIAIWLARSPEVARNAFPEGRPRRSTLGGTLRAGLLAVLILVAVGSLARRGEWEAPQASAPPDYARAESWAALPFREDGADLQIGPVFDPLHDPGADAFFVHPTTFLRADRWNQLLDDAATNRLTDGLVLANQASVFSGCCRVYAPRYRQAAPRAFLADGSAQTRARELAYEDVRRAFSFYLDHYNQGRPIVLAGHSQGSYHASRLLEEFFQGRPLRSRLVAAYLVGMPLRLEALSHAMPDFPVCGGPDETGCILTWNTIGPGADRGSVLSAAAALGGPREETEEPSIACVNPLTWERSDRYVASERNLGGVIVAAEVPEAGVPQPGVADAQCANGLLRVTRVAVETFRKAEGRAGDYHLLDYGLFYMNIRENAVGRVAAYLERRGAADRRNDRQRITAPPTAATALAHWPGVPPR